MINSLTNKIWTNDRNEIFQVLDFYDRQRRRWSNKVRIIENEKTGKHYWLEDSKEDNGHTDATAFISLQIQLNDACEISHRPTSEALILRDRFLKFQRVARTIAIN